MRFYRHLPYSNSCVTAEFKRIFKKISLFFDLSFSLFETKSLFTLKFGDFEALNRDTQEYIHSNSSLRGGHKPDDAISFRVAIFTQWDREIATPLRNNNKDRILATVWIRMAICNYEDHSTFTQPVFLSN